MDKDMNNNILNVFKSLINDIIMLLDKDIDEVYQNILDMNELILDECIIIKTFLNNIDNYSKKIKDKDETLFQENLLPNIDFNELWNSENITKRAKNNIWKYLQTFLIININLNSSKELQELLAGKTTDIDKKNKKDIKDLKNIKQLKDSINNINEEQNKRKNNDIEDISSKLMNTSIGKLAQDIANEVNFEEMIGDNLNSDNPMELISNLMNNGNMMNMFSTINQKVMEKLDEGNLNKNDFESEAANIFSSMQDNNMFKNMLNMTEQSLNANNANNVNNVPKNKTHQRLQKKINNKKK
jgi:hypothetical protein